MHISFVLHPQGAILTVIRQDSILRRVWTSVPTSKNVDTQLVAWGLVDLAPAFSHFVLTLLTAYSGQSIGRSRINCVLEEL